MRGGEWDDKNILYLYESGGYTGVSIFQNIELYT